MKKYLVAVRGFNEPDNNTPADNIFCKIADYEDNELEKVRKLLEREFEEDHPIGVDIKIVPVEELQGKWSELFTIW